MSIPLLFFSMVFVNNFVLSQFLGLCPFLGVSKRIETAIGMSLAVIFVMTLASAATYMVYNFIFVPLDIKYMYNIGFILIIAALVQLVEMFMKKSSPALYRALGVYLPLITTNCAVLGVTVINKDANYTLLLSVLNGMFAGVGLALAMILFAGIRERLESNNIPKPFRDLPIALITAALMSIAFLGFKGIL